MPCRAASRRSSAGPCERRGHRLRLAFSSMPDDAEPPRAARRTRRRSARPPPPGRPARGRSGRRPRARCARRRSRRSASVSSPDSSAILPLILGSPASSSDTTYDFSGRSRRRLAITSATRASTSAGGSGGPVVLDQRAVGRRRRRGGRSTTSRRCGRTAPSGSHRYSTTSPSQSMRTSRTASVLPERLALAPRRLARPAPEVRGAGRQRRRQRLAVRPREHAHHPGARLLRDHRHQPVRVEGDAPRAAARRQRRRVMRP